MEMAISWYNDRTKILITTACKTRILKKQTKLFFKHHIEINIVSNNELCLN